MGRPRFDLDGIALHGDGNTTMVLAILRKRTKEGIGLLMPESGDFSVPWSELESAHIDLAEGCIRLRFTPEFVQKENWLRGQQTLIGRWLDRFELSEGN